MNQKYGFFTGVLVALVLSIAGAAMLGAGHLVVGGSFAFKLVIALLAAAYLGFLLSRSEVKVGRMVASGVWVAAAALILGLVESPGVYLVLHVGLIWLIRSLYFHNGLLAALADLGLCALGLAVAVWALAQTGSMLLGIWCFFLLQALFVGIRPIDSSRKTDQGVFQRAAFERARRDAEKAIQRLVTD